MNLPSPLLMLGLLMVSGLIFSLLASKVRVPRIAAYALAGLVWSPDLLGGRLSSDAMLWSGHLTDTALAIVAYIIGGSMTFSQLKKLGKSIIYCTLGEVFGAIIAVSLSVWLLFTDGGVEGLMFASVLGVLAASTDPAATVAIVHQYRSKGNLTTTILGIAALDDAIGIILFSLLLVWVTGSNLSEHVLGASIEIFGALSLGILVGFLLAKIGHRIRNHNFFLPMVLGALFLSQGLAELWHLSPLLTAMAMGFTARATYQSGGDRLFSPVEYLEELVFLIFFTLAGAHFKLSVFVDAAGLALIYITARVFGKMVGSRFAAHIGQAPSAVKKYVGISLIPQAGIAIGLSLSLVDYPQFRETGIIILNMILASTIIFEVMGPFTTRYALGQAGELKLERAEND